MMHAGSDLVLKPMFSLKYMGIWLDQEADGSQVESTLHSCKVNIKIKNVDWVLLFHACQTLHSDCYAHRNAMHIESLNVKGQG